MVIIMRVFNRSLAMEWPFQRLKTIHRGIEWKVYGLYASDEMFTNEFFILN